MKYCNFRRLTALLLVILLMASCAGSSRIGGTSKHCGCGLNKGLVGY